MPPNRKSDPFVAFIDQLADAIAERLESRFPAHGVKNGVKTRNGGRGRKRDMSCRVSGCKNTSKGPRFRFLCEEHLKLPKKEQNAALEKWKARKAA